MSDSTSGSESSRAPFATQVPQIIGRERELDQLRAYLHERGARHYVYIWADGGLGKTRLLQELQNLCREAGPEFRSAGIIDLYHTETHSTSEMERAIVGGLDPEGVSFLEYREKRAEYEWLREHGASPYVLEGLRVQLSEYLVRECRDIALRARKLVLCFDTIELLQDESSTVEELADLGLMGTRLKPWLLENLGKLGNVLVVFSGRPRRPIAGDQTDRQARLVDEMRASYGTDFVGMELKPLTLEATHDFVRSVSPEHPDIIPIELLPIVHRLTGGKPIFLHLLLDLLQGLTPEPMRILELFKGQQHLVSAAEGSEALSRARQEIEKQILIGIFNNALPLGEYLKYIALMPKGVDAEILSVGLNLSVAQACDLLRQIDGLSFVKKFIGPEAKSDPDSRQSSNVGAGLHGGRVFLHDEMYRLLTMAGVIQNVPFSERQIASALVDGYYNPRIEDLADEIKNCGDVAHRIALRDRMHTLQIECLYYILVRNPANGYATYQLLTEGANRGRWVGFGMRLLDEFLRYYNAEERKKRFHEAVLGHEAVIRESAMMWVERYYTWGQYRATISIADRVLAAPATVYLESGRDCGIIGIIMAYRALSWAIVSGYDKGIVDECIMALASLPPLSQCSRTQALARARLSNAIGYMNRIAGILQEAVSYYAASREAYRRLSTNLSEYAMVLNNSAYAHALLGEFHLARLFGHDALEINESLGEDYPTGLTYSTLACVARMHENYDRAIEYGELALTIHERVQDSHGIVMARIGLAEALRKAAQHDLRLGHRLERVYDYLERAEAHVEETLMVLDYSNLREEQRLAAYAQEGCVYREMGHLSRRLGDLIGARSHYERAERMLIEAMGEEMSLQDRVDALQDLAEVRYALGRDAQAEMTLCQIEERVGRDYLILSDWQRPSVVVSCQYFVTLGKVSLMRGRMALDRGDVGEGARQYFLAAAYYLCFSPQARQMDSLVDDVGMHFRDLTAEERSTFCEVLAHTVEKSDLASDLRDFVGTVMQIA